MVIIHLIARCQSLHSDVENVENFNFKVLIRKVTTKVGWKSRAKERERKKKPNSFHIDDINNCH